jgi:RimJ/RimL family protein N-acetyltransferase
VITFERTRDYPLVREILTHPQLYRFLGDDATPAAAEFEVNEHPAIWYVLARDESYLLGVFTLIPQNAVCFEIHAAMLPESWGQTALEALQRVFLFMTAESGCRRIVASIPACNRLAIRYGERAGMTQFGVNPDSFLRGGTLYSQVLLGISTKEIECPPS